MAKSVLYAVNPNSQILAIGDAVNFGSAVRKYGSACGISGGTPFVHGPGYYMIDTNFTLEATGAGDVTITLYQNGMPIAGATDAKTVGAGSVYNFSIPAVIREECCCEKAITAVISGVGATVTNAAIIVERL